MADPAPDQAGWSIATEFAAQGAEAAARNFYALYEGNNFGAPDRGALAIIARAHADGRSNSTGVRDAVQIAVHSFAEGYFGARRTVSPRKAAVSALASLNRWLAGQVQGESGWHLAPVSVSGLLLRDRRIGMAQVGACQMYRLRGGMLTPLMPPHVRPPDAVPFMPTRALGLEPELALDMGEEEAEPGDVYLLIAGLAATEGVYAALAPLLGEAGEKGFAGKALAALEHLPARDKSVMVLRVRSLPEAEPEMHMRAALARLPIRPPPREGDVWDDFEIRQTLFKGRYTLLVAARDKRSNREVALKLPLPSMLQDEVFTAGFMREAWIGTAVRGQNVVRYIDVPDARRTSLYLVMPLYHGETLEKRLNRAPPMSLPEGMGIIFRLCEAVQDLAAIEVVHRDLKPDNVMLLETGEIRLLDLGLAYLPGIDTANAARPGGTIRYMAPELLRGAPANARTEVYALAVTFYRMFSGGAFPYGQHEKWPLQRLRADLPAWLGEALGKGLAAKPEERFEDAGAFARVLQIGLVEGRDKPAPRRWRLFGDLRLWRGLALLFALLFVVTLLRTMK
ncbi:protein kinase domain-containing protein [Acidocella sp.]|uniref:bifunctional protein-serine/threonine kinase/phosphatase n=1 Tax=Acidocella sp. TaxID=50710 RepID=UPI003D011187